MAQLSQIRQGAAGGGAALEGLDWAFFASGKVAPMPPRADAALELTFQRRFMFFSDIDCIIHVLNNNI